MRGRAPRQALQHRRRVHAMAAAAACHGARGTWQLCLSALTGLCRVEARVDGRVAIAAVETLSRTSRKEAISRPSFSWGSAVEEAFTAASGRIWSPTTTTARQLSFAVPGSSILGHKVSGDSSWKLNAMPLSTSPVSEQQNASENLSTENVISTEETVVASASTSASASELEFAPENESTPSTPLVQAIQSLEGPVATEEQSTADDELPSLFGENATPEISALPPSDSGRVVQPGRIYIGGLPFGMKGDELRDGLRELCGEYGTVTEVNLAQHRHQSQASIATGKHRGFAFVMMETPEQAKAVIDGLHGTSMWGRTLMVSYGLKKILPDPSVKVSNSEKAVVRCKVFVGNLHEGTTRQDLLTKFQQYGTVVNIKLITELHSSRSRGFAFVTFSQEGEAIQAVLDCDGSIMDGSIIRVNIAKYPQGY